MKISEGGKLHDYVSWMRSYAGEIDPLTELRSELRVLECRGRGDQERLSCLLIPGFCAQRGCAARGGPTGTRWLEVGDFTLRALVEKPGKRSKKHRAA